METRPIQEYQFDALRHITWRGAIRSCNYTCSYCPFATHQPSERERAQDELALQNLESFLTKQRPIQPLSLLLAPYGEALIHEHVCMAMARLSQLDQLAIVSCQTNLSFNPQHLLQTWSDAKADFSKLTLWASYHPSMTTVEDFSNSVRWLAQQIRLCVVAVGDPSQINSLRRLSLLLPSTVPLRINAMDGLKRRYHQEEIAAFTALDPLFPLELHPHNGYFSLCGAGRQSIFVEAGGNFYPCNRCHTRLGNLYDNMPPLLPLNSQESCGGRCDCFLSYSNRKDLVELFSLNPHPQLRLDQAKRIEAVFFDFDGTLSDGQGKLRPSLIQPLYQLAQYYHLYLATALPLDEVWKRLGPCRDYFSGGIFALGADVRDFPLKRQEMRYLPATFDDARRTYLMHGQSYKQVLRHMPKRIPESCQIVREGGHLSLISHEAQKLSGVYLIASWNDWQEEQIVVMGDGLPDVAMLNALPISIAPNTASEQARQAARYHMSAEILCEHLLSERAKSRPKYLSPKRHSTQK